VFQSARQIGSEAFLNLLFNEIISRWKGEHGVVNIQVNTCKVFNNNGLILQKRLHSLKEQMN
jgi:hypothetical protein